MANEIRALEKFTEHMKLQQVSESCFAVLCEKNRVCDANSGLINLGGGVVIARQLQEDYNFDGIKLVLPTTVFDERHALDLDGTEVHIIYVGPCHQAGDTIVHVPKEGVVFAGDVLFRLCTPIGWTGTYAQWLKILDLIISLKPKVIVPGHGPVCGIEGVTEMKAYLEYLRDESRHCFEQGLTSLEASKRIDF